VHTRSYVAGSTLTNRCDWFECSKSGFGRARVVIVAVHGTDWKAAARFAVWRASVRLAYRAERPATLAWVLERLARLIDAVDPEAVVTVISYGVVRGRRMRRQPALRWSNAGHFPPLLRGSPTERYKR